MKNKLLITTSILNSWRYLFTVDEQWYDGSFEDFKRALRREPWEGNQYTKAGLDFEDLAMEGKVPGISEIIENGSFQYRATKDKVVDGQEFLMYGRIDVLKNGEIIDIKLKNNISKYNVGEYLEGVQHHFYMEMIPEAKRFRYLIGNKNSKAKIAETGLEYTIREESIEREECVDMSSVIRQFINWLKANDLYDVYVEHWQTN